MHGLSYRWLLAVIIVKVDKVLVIHPTYLAPFVLDALCIFGLTACQEWPQMCCCCSVCYLLDIGTVSVFRIMLHKIFHLLHLDRVGTNVDSIDR